MKTSTKLAIICTIVFVGVFICVYSIGSLLMPIDSPKQKKGEYTAIQPQSESPADYNQFEGEVQIIETDQNQEMPDAIDILEQQSHQLLIDQKQILENELRFFDIPFDVYSHCRTETSIQNLLGLFGAWPALIKARESSEDADIRYLANQLKDKVVKCQIEAFPMLRKEYARVIGNNIMITHDDLGFIGGSEVDYVTMSVGGNRNTVATYTWWGLVADRNKAIFKNRVVETLAILRFTRAKLQSAALDSEPLFFTPFKGTDSDLIIL